MKARTILKLLSMLLGLMSVFMLACALVGAYFGESSDEIFAFLIPFALCAIFVSTVFLFVPGREKPFFSAREGYVFVTASWVAASAVGALPFILSGVTGNYADAFFETMSGFTTTGASVFGDIESLPRSIQLWRSTTHWLGGMGIVVLTVAILPLLGLGGLQLVEAEAPGPTVDKITPRMAGTAKILWLIYIVFTAAETLLLRLGGMGWFDSLNHAFATLATGGFSTKNASVGHWNSAYVDAVITVFMLLAGMNFGLFYKIAKGDLRGAFRDSEARAYVGVFAAASIAIAVSINSALGKGIVQAFRYSSFQVASILTTTGFATADFDLWPGFAKVILFSLMLIGGCAGSTGGGVKVVRYLVLIKQTMTELKYLVFPRGVFTVRVNGQPVRKMMIFDTATFFFLYFLTLVATTLVVASAGYGLESSFTTALATLGNIGPGFGAVGPMTNYEKFPDYVVWALNFAMLAGRLELFTVFAVFPALRQRR